MRRVVFSLAVLFVSLLPSAKGHAITISEIDFWVGSGANQTALVIDWKDGKQPLIWGYQWDGVVTAEQMFLDVVAADDRLYARTSQFVWGMSIIGVGYDRNDDGFALSDGTLFINGIFDGPPSDGAAATDAEDSYVEGWNTGFWGFFVADGNPYLDDDAWGFADAGLSDTELVNGSFLGFAFAPDFDGGPPNEPIPAAPGASLQPIPEPASLLMLGMGALALIIRRR